MASYVGIDLHRRRSVIVVLNEAGDRVWSSRIENSIMNLELELRAIIEKVEAPVHVVVEATWGWYWTTEVIATVGAEMHLAHPLAIKGYENRRVKTDWLDAELLADLLRMDRLPEAWIAPGRSGSCQSWSATAAGWPSSTLVEGPSSPDARQGRSDPGDQEHLVVWGTAVAR